MSSSSPDCPISVDPQRCGDACERLRQHDAMHRRIFAAIAAIGREVASTQQLDRILQLVMDKAAETVPMDAGLIFRLDEAAQMYRVAVAYKLPPQELDYIHFAFRHGVPGWVVEQGVLANALDYFLAVLGRRRGGERPAPFRVERLDYRNQDRTAFYQGLERNGPKAVEEFRAAFG